MSGFDVSAGHLRKKMTPAGEAFFPAAATLLIFLAVLWLKGIFPFGMNRIDYYDMGQTNVPLYFHIWDFLHGKSPLFYDWFINEGQNLSMGSAIQWNISPLNLFFLLIPRNLVLPSLSVFMGLHLFCMAFAMGIFLRCVLPETGYGYRALFSLCYGLCGYTLTHYTIPTYLDTSVFLPLLALALWRLLKDGKPFFYALMLGFTTALSYYLGFMHLIYILLFSGVFLFIAVPGDEAGRALRRDRTAKLGLSTIAGLALSAFMLLPAVLQMLRSSRFRSNGREGLVSTLFGILQSIGADEYYVKWWQLYAMEAALVLILFGLIRCRKEWRKCVTVMGLCFIPCALIPFEAVNILWHFGTYYHYPIRCGYLIPFSLLTGGAWAAGELFPVKEFCRTEGEPLPEKEGRRMEGELLPEKESFRTEGGRSGKYLFLWMTAVTGLIYIIKIYVNHEIWEVKDLFRIWVPLAVLFASFYAGCLFLSLKYPKKLSFFRAVLPFVLAELIFGAFIGYGCPHFTDSFFGDPEQSGDYAETAVELMGLLAREDGSGPVMRVKNPDTDLNTNYGMVMRRGTVTGWANTITGTQQTAAQKLGYGTHFMRILDSGGTAFTDSLLGVREVLTRVPRLADSPVLQEKGSEETSHGTWYLYENKASFPFGIPVSSGPGAEYVWEELSGLAEELSYSGLQNLLYRAVSGEESEILKDLGKGREGESLREFQVKGNQALYLSGGRADEIRVNGQTVPVPTIGDMENTEWPAWFNSSVLPLGTFQDEKVTVECPEKSRLFLLDLDLLLDLSESLRQTGTEAAVRGRTLEVSVTCREGRDMALLPLHADPGLTVRVNGEKTEATDIMGVFTGVSLSPGENQIRISFTPPGLLPGAMVSFIALLLLVIVFLFGKGGEKGEYLVSLSGKGGEKEEDIVFLSGKGEKKKEGYSRTDALRNLRSGFFEIAGRAAAPVFTVIFGAAALFLYVLPILWCLIHVVAKRLL